MCNPELDNYVKSPEKQLLDKVFEIFEKNFSNQSQYIAPDDRGHGDEFRFFTSVTMPRKQYEELISEYKKIC